MIRSVFDANAVVSSFPADTGTFALLVERWRAGAFGLVLSEYMFDEIIIAWSKPYWRARMSQHEIESALTLLRRDAEITPITFIIEGLRHTSKTT